MGKFGDKKYFKATRHLKSHSIDYLKLGTTFAWFYSEKEKPSVTRKEGFIIRSATEYFSAKPSSRQIKAVYNAWKKDIGGAKSYAENLRLKSSVTNVSLKNKAIDGIATANPFDLLMEDQAELGGDGLWKTSKRNLRLRDFIVTPLLFPRRKRKVKENKEMGVIESQCTATHENEELDILEDQISSDIAEETLSKLTRSTLSANKTFFTTILPEKTTTLIDASDWNKLKPNRLRRNKLCKGWTDILYNYLKKSNPYCALVFKWHKAKCFSGRKNTAKFCFIANGSCSSKHCPLKFKIFMLSSEENKRILHIHYMGNVLHDMSERRARPIAGELRTQVVDDFKYSGKKPSTYFNEKINNLDERLFSAGNWTGVGSSPKVVQQIASEARRSLRLDDNPITSLEMMKTQFVDEASKTTKIKGYIQYIAASPLVVHLWT